MKKIALALATSVLFSLSATANTPTSVDTVISVSEVFVPGGFDKSSDVFVVVSGVFPNGCYSWKEAQVTHISDTEHEVRSYASVQQGMCIMVLVPFSKEVRLGKFNSGEHTLRFVNGDGTFLEKKMTVQ